MDFTIAKDILSSLAIIVPAIAIAYRFMSEKFGRISWWEIKKGVKDLHEQMVRDDFSPKLIVCLGRSGSIVGAMLSGCFDNMIPIVTLNFQYTKDYPHSAKQGREHVRSEDLIDYCVLKPGIDGVLLLGVDILTGGTMAAAMEELKKRNIDDYSIACLYLHTNSKIMPRFFHKKKNIRPRYPWMTVPFWKSWSTVPGRVKKKRGTLQEVAETFTNVDLYLVRHGETLAGNEIFCGKTDYDLSTIGMEQASNAGQLFQGESVQRIYTSPLGRARNTAQIIQGFLPYSDLVEDNNLREMNFGEWENRSHSEIKAESPEVYQKWNQDPLNICPEGAESPYDILKRMKGFLNNVEKKFRARGEIKIIAVTHQNTMRILLSEIENTPLEYYRKINIKNGEVIHISFDGDSWSRKE